MRWCSKCGGVTKMDEHGEVCGSCGQDQDQIHPGHRYGSENPELQARLDAGKETQTPTLPRATPDASIPLARMLADELKKLHKGDYLAAQDRVDALLATIDALPEMTVQDHFAIAMLACPRLKAEEGQNKYLVLRSNWDDTAEFPQELVLDLNWLDKETGKPSGFLSDWGQLHPAVAALAHATWSKLKEKQG